MLVYSWNEYFEQSQIEPTVEQGDRYLVLNQLLARRFKDGRPLGGSDAERLLDTLPHEKSEEKVAWLPIDDARLKAAGLEPLGQGRAALREQAQLDLDVDSEQAFVVGIAHAPSFDRCAGLSVTISGGGSDKTASFPTELTQLSILRDSPLPKSVGHLKLLLRRVPTATSCPASGGKPIVLTGITRYPLSTAERLNFRIDDPNVHLDGFWAIEAPPSGSFAWSRERSTVTLSDLTPGVRHRMTLTFRDTAGFGNVEVGPDPEHLRRLVITPGRTATYPDPFTVSRDGTLAISMKTPTWRPHERFGSDDPRALGLAVRLVTLDRLEGVSSPHDRR